MKGRRAFLWGVVFLGSGLSFWQVLGVRHPQVAAAESETPGALRIIDKDGKETGFCPLKSTDVKAEISGVLARVTLTQQFHNSSDHTVEAIYTFPLSQNAAVDDMTLRVGERIVRGAIKRREEAQAIYDASRRAGQVAALLDQERPNIFTQSVANILPGEEVQVTISYVETVKYQAGHYEFVFPMVVAPRYIPGNAIGRQSGGWAPDTNKVPDASRITPPVAKPGTRAGHDIAIEILLDAGLPLANLRSPLHEIEDERRGPLQAVVRLKHRRTIPNRDFILQYDVAGSAIRDAVFAYHDGVNGYFSLILQPPQRPTQEDITPKELVFVLDTSGSMSGFPIEKAKETMRLALDSLNPTDTFNLITFSGDTHILFPEPVPGTLENLQKAKQFLESRSGSGGTEMMKAVRAALAPSHSGQHVHIVCFMTDGEVGNDMEILAEIQRHPNARVFAFGIGDSVNRFLLDGMARHGRGAVEYVTLADDGSAAARRFHERVRNPLLTDISLEWGSLPVIDIYPKKIPDLFDAEPVVLYGRYQGEGRGKVQLAGKIAGQAFRREVEFVLPARQTDHAVLASLWARHRVDDLMAQDFEGIQQGSEREDIREQIVQLGLQYRLMTQFTSLVAVEEVVVTDGGVPRRIQVPVEIPSGVTYEGLSDLPAMGLTSRADRFSSRSVVGGLIGFDKRVGTGAGSGAGMGGGVIRQGGGGGGGGGVSGLASPAVPPPPPPAQPARSARLVAPARTVSEEERQRQEVRAKLHPSLAAVVERLKKGSAPSRDETKFVHNGKVELQIWLTEKSPEVMTKLKTLGLDIIVEPKTNSLVIGRIALEKLPELASLAAVRYLSPQFLEP